MFYESKFERFDKKGRVDRREGRAPFLQRLQNNGRKFRFKYACTPSGSLNMYYCTLKRNLDM